MELPRAAQLGGIRADDLGSYPPAAWQTVKAPPRRPMPVKRQERNMGLVLILAVAFWLGTMAGVLIGCILAAAGRDAERFDPREHLSSSVIPGRTP